MTYEPLYLREPDADDPREAGMLLVLQADDMVWPMSREQAQDLRDRLDAALAPITS